MVGATSSEAHHTTAPLIHKRFFLLPYRNSSTNVYVQTPGIPNQISVCLLNPKASFQSVTGGLARRLCKTRPVKIKSDARMIKSGNGVRFLGTAPLQLRRLGKRCKFAQWGPERNSGKCGLGAFRRFKNQVISTFHSWLAVFSFWSCAKNFISQSLGPLDPSSTA